MARILIIEDHPTNMKLACLMMENAGHVAVSAVDAEIGLTMARDEQVDLILMDIQLPGMDGLTATKLLKADLATARIPVIAVTAAAKPIDEQMARAAGCDDFVSKPVRYKELLEKINALLGQNTLKAA